MAFINTLCNAFMCVAQPTGVWEKIIMAFNSGIKNYALAIIVLTLVIKIVMFPFDFFNRKISRKQTKMQAIIQPEIEILKKKYGNDKNVMNQKTMELYKKHNYNLGGSCLFMLINIVLTFFIFITLFTGLNSMSAYKISEQYNELKMAYYNVESIEDITPGMTVPEGANERTAIKYEDVRDGFLWIENVWIADSPLSKSIPSFEQYASVARLSNDEAYKNLSDEQKTAYKDEYEAIMTPLRESSRKENGYFILLVLIVGTTFLQQLLINSRFKKSRKKDVLANEPETPKQPGGKAMMIIMPILMGVFAFKWNAVFALYLLVSSLFGMISSPIINTILFKLDKKEAEKEKLKKQMSYSRKR